MKKTLLTILFLLFVFNVKIKSQVNVTIDTETQYQKIEGFGGFNTIRLGKNNWTDPLNDRYDMLVNDLGLTVLRLELFPSFKESATSDYSIDGGGFASTSTSATWDDAIGLNALDSVKVIATVWSPPGWMKASGSTVGVDRDPVADGIQDPLNYLQSSHYSTFGDYLLEYIRRFNSYTGSDLFAISLQNELAFQEPYNSCVYTPYQYHDALAVVGSIIKSANPPVNTKIFGPEDMGRMASNYQWIEEALDNDVVTRGYLDAYAVHGYGDGITADGGDAPGWESMYNDVNKYNKQLWMTETSGYIDAWDGDATREGAFDLAKNIYLALKSGKISLWTWWALADDTAAEQYGLIINGQGRARYFVSKNYYRYIRPNAMHVHSSSDNEGVLVIAFKHTEESRLTVVLINNTSSSQTVNLDMGSYTLPGSFTVYRTSSTENCENVGTVTNNTFSLPGESISTLVYEGTNNGPTMDPMENMILVNSAGQQTIDLSGITDGGEGGQTISISAVSSDPSVIPNPSVTYSTGSTGSLNFTPQSGQSGDVSISVILEDDGDDTGDLNRTVKTFNVKVLPFINAAPTINDVADFTAYLDDGQQMIVIEGLSDGNDGSQTLSIDAEPEVPQALSVAAVKDGNTIQFYYQPILEGNIPITLTVKDNGGEELGGEDTKTITFTISIVKGSAPAPTQVDEINSTICIYPNPVQSFLYVYSGSVNFNKIVIYDLNGQMKTITTTDLTNHSEINVSALQSGVYMLQLLEKDKVIAIKKLVVQ